MISKRHVEGNWLTRAQIASSRYQDPGLSALLVALLVMIFLAEPLAFKGFVLPVAVTGIVIAGLVFLLVLGSHHNGALILVVVAGGIRLLTAAIDVLWGASVNEGAEAISAMLALLGITWVISRIVFGPVRITTHRVRGVIVLYLTTAVFFAYLYRLIAQVVPGAFSGLAFRTGEHGALSPFLYLVPRRNLWAIDGLNRVTCEGRKAGSASPDGTANCASARRIAVKPCACGAPLCGFGA